MRLSMTLVCLLVFLASLARGDEQHDVGRFSLEERTVTTATDWNTQLSSEDSIRVDTGWISQNTKTIMTVVSTINSGTMTGTVNSSSSSKSSSHSTSSTSSAASSTSDESSTTSDSDESSSTERGSSTAESSTTTDDASSKTTSGAKATTTSSADKHSSSSSTFSPSASGISSLSPPPITSTTSSSTPTPTATPTPAGDSSPANIGTIVGTVIGVAGALIIFAIFIAWFIRRCKARARRQAQSPDEELPGPWPDNNNHNSRYVAPNTMSARTLSNIGASRFYAEADPAGQVHEVPARPTSAPAPGAGDAMEMRPNSMPRMYRGVSMQEQPQRGDYGGAEVPESLRPGRRALTPPWTGEQQQPWRAPAW